jgi:hypothetical protein
MLKRSCKEKLKDISMKGIAVAQWPRSHLFHMGKLFKT